MSDQRQILVNVWLDKSEKAFQDAELLFNNDRFAGCLNRLYYSAFYAVCGALLSIGTSSKTHKGVKALFHEHLISSGKIDNNYAALYSKLFTLRHEADYLDFPEIEANEIQELLEQTSLFITIIKKNI
jgi:uncharacterized protein (UPF0332 family)